MQERAVLPTRGDVFLDAREDGRSLRVSAHPEDGVVVVSHWRGDRCVATFRLAAADVAGLRDVLDRSVDGTLTS